jgi:hypothetical protein
MNIIEHIDIVPMQIDDKAKLELELAPISSTPFTTTVLGNPLTIISTNKNAIATIDQILDNGSDLHLVDDSNIFHK